MKGGKLWKADKCITEGEQYMKHEQKGRHSCFSGDMKHGKHKNGRCSHSHATTRTKQMGES